MKMIKRVLLLGIALAGLYVAMLAVPAAMAATTSDPAPMAPYGGPPSFARHAAVRTSSTGTMHGWEIALITLAAALVITIGDRVLIRARAAHRPVARTG
jgi:hypothetical protein